MQQLHPGVLQDPTAGYQNTWGTAFSSVHGPLARIAEFNGLLDGLPLQTTSADPNAPMTRGECAQVLWNTMNLIAPSRGGSRPAEPYFMLWLRSLHRQRRRRREDYRAAVVAVDAGAVVVVGDTMVVEGIAVVVDGTVDVVAAAGTVSPGFVRSRPR